MKKLLLLVTLIHIYTAALAMQDNLNSLSGSKDWTDLYTPEEAPTYGSSESQSQFPDNIQKKTETPPSNEKTTVQEALLGEPHTETSVILPWYRTVINNSTYKKPLYIAGGAALTLGLVYLGAELLKK